MALRIGTSGWSYPSGKGTWTGVFYPARDRRPRGFDELAYYAEHFDTVEVNSSFYGIPGPEIARSWVRRTPPRFEFSLKLYQQFTHPGMYQDRLRGELAVGDQALLDALTRPTEADIDRFKAGIDPVASAGRLGALLAQFPPSFHDSPETREYLSWLLQAFADFPLAVELRHKSWSDDVAATLELLNGARAAWVQIDEPKFRFSIRQNYLPNVRGFYYMRLHGRNVAQWWHHDRAEDRYNYLYSAGELLPFAETARAADAIVRKAYVYLNNHFAAKAVANAAELKHEVGQPLTGSYEPEMVARYPELAGLVRVEPVMVSRSRA